MSSRYDPNKHHRRSTRLKGYDYSQPGVYFITICTWQHACILGDVHDGEMYLNPFGRAVSKVWQGLPKYYPYVILGEFCVMPNHVHAIINLTDDHSSHKRHGLSEIVRAFKSFSTRQINTIRKTFVGPVWQRNYYEHIIRNEEALQKIIQYIRSNPFNWDHDQENPNLTSQKEL
jgi:putative transposase